MTRIGCVSSQYSQQYSVRSILRQRERTVIPFTFEVLKHACSDQECILTVMRTICGNVNKRLSSDTDHSHSRNSLVTATGGHVHRALRESFVHAQPPTRARGAAVCARTTTSVIPMRMIRTTHQCDALRGFIGVRPWPRLHDVQQVRELRLSDSQLVSELASQSRR